MQRFIRKPSIDLYEGIKVTKDTELDFKNENVTQKLKDLVLRTTVRIEGEGFKGVNRTHIFLKEGDVLIFEGDGRGYIKPIEGICTIEEAIDDLTNIKDLG